MAMEKTYSMIKPDGVRNGHIGKAWQWKRRTA